jgi:hypothetical protein
MGFQHCQFSHVIWLDKASTTYHALMKGLGESSNAAVTATATFIDGLATAHQAFQKGLQPGADLNQLVKAYQAATGIISTREFALPDVPNSQDPVVSTFASDMISGIVGALSTEIGIGISVYTLILDLIELLDIKVHIRGVLMNDSTTDLKDLYFRIGYGEPAVLPLATSLPGTRMIMDPLNKTNYECAGFVLFGAVGFEPLQGLNVGITAQDAVPMYLQYYTTSSKGVAPGTEEGHEELSPAENFGAFTGVLADRGLVNSVSLFVVHGR